MTAAVERNWERMQGQEHSSSSVESLQIVEIYPSSLAAVVGDGDAEAVMA